MTASTGSFDGPLSAIRGHVDLGAWLAIWANRAEPDAHARRCAGDAVKAIDAMLGHMYGVRTQLVSEIARAMTRPPRGQTRCSAASARPGELPARRPERPVTVRVAGRSRA